MDAKFSKGLLMLPFYKKLFFLAFILSLNLTMCFSDSAEDAAKSSAQVKLFKLNDIFSNNSSRMDVIDDRLIKLEALLLSLQRGAVSTSPAGNITNSANNISGLSTNPSTFSQSLSTSAGGSTSLPKQSTSQKIKSLKEQFIGAVVLEQLVKKYLLKDKLIVVKLGLNFSNKSPSQVKADLEKIQVDKKIKSFSEFSAKSTEVFPSGSVAREIISDSGAELLIYQRLTVNESFYVDNKFEASLFDKTTEADRIVWAKRIVATEVAKTLNTKSITKLLTSSSKTTGSKASDKSSPKKGVKKTTSKAKAL